MRIFKCRFDRFDDEYEINEKEMNYFLLLYQGDIECIIKIVCINSNNRKHGALNILRK